MIFLVLFRCDSISRCMATFCSLEIVADMIKIAKRIITPLKVKFLHKKTFYVLRLSECPKLWVWLSRDFLSCFGKNADQNYISDWKVLLRLRLIESNFSDVWITPLTEHHTHRPILEMKQIHIEWWGVERWYKTGLFQFWVSHLCSIHNFKHECKYYCSIFSCHNFSPIFRSLFWSSTEWM